MLKIPTSYFRHPTFVTAWEKVRRAQGFRDVRVTHNVVRVSKLMEGIQEKIQTDFRAMLKNFAVLDEKGEFKNKVVDGNEVPDSFDIPNERRSDWQGALEKFEETLITISAKPFQLRDFGSCNLSPEELEMLMPFITELELVDSPRIDLARN